MISKSTMEYSVLAETHLSEDSHLTKILQCVQDGVRSWYQIVKTLGLDPAVKTKWQDELYDFIEGTIDEATACARERQNTLREKIECLLEESEKKCKLLSIKMSKFKSTNQGLYNDKKYLIGKLKGWKDEVNRRMEEINQLKVRRDEVSKTLGRQPFHIRESPLPARESLESYLEKIEVLEIEKQQRVIKYNQIQKEIAALAAEIQYTSSLNFERHIISGDEGYADLSDENMQRVIHFHHDLIEKRDHIEVELSKLRETLQSLWKILEEDVKYCNDFIRDHVGLNLNTLEAFRYEVRRCDDIRKTNLQKFIVKLREELKSLWQKAAYSQARREPFMRYMEDNLYTEDLLTLHDIQIERVKTFLSNNAKIFELLEQREGLYNRMRDLEERANAPDRFKNRGGQLLKEEKERKIIMKKIPATEGQLLDLVTVYEEEHGEKFMFWEESVEDVIAKSKQFMEQTFEISLRTLLRRAVKPLSNPPKFPRYRTMRRIQSKRTPLFKSPSASLLSSRNLHTPSLLKTPVTGRNLLTPNTAPVKRVIHTVTTVTTGRRSITKAKAMIRRSMDKRKHMEALRGACVDYSNFQDNVSKRSTLAEQSENFIPAIRLETPRTTVVRQVKHTSSKGRLHF